MAYFIRSGPAASPFTATRQVIPISATAPEKHSQCQCGKCHTPVTGQPVSHSGVPDVEIVEPRPDTLGFITPLTRPETV